MTTLTPHKSLAAEEIAQLQWAAERWDSAAQSGGTEASQNTCRLAAKSIRLHLETGKPHCTCHLQPLAQDGICSVYSRR